MHNTSSLPSALQSVEVVVLGNIGSGKTTLINSIFGETILPSTATNAITRIHGNHGGGGFSAMAQDASGKSLDRIESLDEESMNRLNELPDVAMVDCFDHIPNIASNGNELIVTDTPYSVETQIRYVREIQNSDKRHILLYVLDSAHFECLGQNLIDCIVKQNVAGNNNGALFLLSKADQFNSGRGESAAKMLDKARKYLEDHGIINPRIMPVSALLAKLIRQNQNHESLSDDEEDFLFPKIRRFIQDPLKHFTDYAHFLSPATGTALKARVEKAKAENNEMELALLYSGVPSVEMAISEYLTSFQSTLI